MPRNQDPPGRQLVALFPDARRRCRHADHVCHGAGTETGMDSLLAKDGRKGGTDMVAEGEEGFETESV